MKSISETIEAFFTLLSASLSDSIPEAGLKIQYFTDEVTTDFASYIRTPGCLLYIEEITPVSMSATTRRAEIRAVLDITYKGKDVQKSLIRIAECVLAWMESHVHPIPGLILQGANKVEPAFDRGAATEHGDVFIDFVMIIN